MQALAKGDRDELAVQAATELGVDEIVPWQAARSVSRWDAAKAREGPGPLGRDRARGREAGAPRVASRGRAARDGGARSPTGPRHPVSSSSSRAPTTRSPRWNCDPDDERDVMLVVGPEGGIAPEELALFERAGATLVRLGDTVLRTSTAGPGGPGRRQRGARPLVSARLP